MLARRLGHRGPELSVIGVGAWAIGGSGYAFSWGDQDDALSVAAIHRALDEGMNWIDTAAVYGLGHSEEVVGRAIRDRREDVFVATKCTFQWGADGEIFRRGTRESVRWECEQSLLRLAVDHLDLLQIHQPVPDVPVEETWGGLAQLQDEGKVMSIGVSNFDVELMTRCMVIRQVDSIQPLYNLLEREIEDEVLPYCEANGIGVIPYGTMAHGFLSGTFEPAKLTQGDWRSREDLKPRIERALRAVEHLRPIARERGVTVGQLATAWTLEHPTVTAAIVGIRSVEQATQAIGAVGVTGGPVRGAVAKALGDDGA